MNQTLGRTIITAGTALLSALALFLFGGEVLRSFAFTMIVGIITGTYSSVFIAAAIVTFWRGKGPRRPRARAGDRPPRRARRSSRRASRSRSGRHARPRNLELSIWNLEFVPVYEIHVRIPNS